jgi:DNA-binding GntR family transcriptional regulator
MAPATDNPTTREFRADATYDKVRDLIVDGRLAPGSRIIETDLVERLEVSRTTVRTALQKLESEGLVIRLEGGRARWLVSPLTKADLRELSEILSALEAIAARRAAELDSSSRRKLVDELRDINEQIRDVAKETPPDSGLAARLDNTFHHHLVQASAGPRLMTYCEALKGQVARYVRTYVAYLARESFASADEHASIITAINSGNPEAAEIAIQANWTEAARRYVEVIETVGERGTW